MLTAVVFAVFVSAPALAAIASDMITGAQIKQINSSLAAQIL